MAFYIICSFAVQSCYQWNRWLKATKYVLKSDIKVCQFICNNCVLVFYCYYLANTLQAYISLQLKYAHDTVLYKLRKLLLLQWPVIGAAEDFRFPKIAINNVLRSRSLSAQFTSQVLVWKLRGRCIRYIYCLGSFIKIKVEFKKSIKKYILKQFLF